MKKWLIALLLATLAGGGVWAWHRYLYVEPPRDAYLRTISAAMLGDEQTFLDGFTDESRPLVAGLLALARGDDIKSSQRHPYYYLVSERIDRVDIEGDHAWVRLQRAGDGASAKYDVPMTRVAHTWRIDALAFTGKTRAIAKVR